LVSTTTYQDNKTIKGLDHQRLGPFFIVKQFNVMVFQLKLPSSMRIHLLFHVSLLELYHISTIPRRIRDPLTPIKVNGEHEYKMEDIWDSRISNCQLQYFIH
jgi:hypothetical protein